MISTFFLVTALKITNTSFISSQLPEREGRLVHDNRRNLNGTKISTKNEALRHANLKWIASVDRLPLSGPGAEFIWDVEQRTESTENFCAVKGSSVEGFQYETAPGRARPTVIHVPVGQRVISTHHTANAKACDTCASS